MDWFLHDRDFLHERDFGGYRHYLINLQKFTNHNLCKLAELKDQTSKFKTLLQVLLTLQKKTESLLLYARLGFENIRLIERLIE